jgi:hypothetical protein
MGASRDERRSLRMLDEPSSSDVTPAELRAEARHSRHLACDPSISDKISRRFRRLADELDAAADVLEAAEPILVMARKELLRPP